LRSRRNFSTRATTPGLSRVGLRCGRLDRSANAASPPARNRVTHFRTVARASRDSAATWACGRPSSKIRATRRRRPSAVNGASACTGRVSFEPGVLRW